MEHTSLSEENGDAEKSSPGHTFIGNVLRNDALSLKSPVPDANARIEVYFEQFRSLPFAVLLIEPSTYRILDANTSACSLYQRKAADLRSLNYTELSTETERESVILQNLREEVIRYDTSHKAFDGHELDVVCRASRIRYGTRGAILLIIEDPKGIAGRNRIQMSRVEWRDSVDAVSDMIILEDAEGRIRRCNQATSQFLNLPYEKLLGKNVVDLFKQRDSDAIEHLRSESWEGRFEVSDEWFEIRTRKVKSDLGSGPGWVHVIKNITESVSSKQELLRLYSVIEQSTDGMAITRLDGTIKYVNAAFETMQRTKRKECVGMNISIIKPELTSAFLNEKVLPHLKKERIWRSVFRTRHDHDDIFEEVSISLVVSSSGEPTNLVISIRDVTENRQLESIAEALNMMQNVGYIFSGIRHELGNPINSVKMALTVLEMNHRKWSPEQMDVYIRRCLAELVRVEYLLRTLKSFSLHEHISLEDTDLEDFLRKFIPFIKMDLESRGINISLSCPERTSLVQCDPRALHQILLNLVTNAVDAMADVEAPEIMFRLINTRNSVSLNVVDNGTGISQKQMANLFKPFYTSKPNGSGLGLVIVKKMMAIMGGTIKIESEFGIGTCVRLNLRLKGDPPVGTEEQWNGEEQG